MTNEDKIKILLLEDRDVTINLGDIVTNLNRVFSSIEFESYPEPRALNSLSKDIDFKKEILDLKEYFSRTEKDYLIYVTLRKYTDNYFYHSTQNIMILSFANWEFYTSLPLENGLLYFIGHALALRIDNTFRHMEKTGCVYDFLETKTDVDIGMKLGFVCEKCMELLRQKARSPAEMQVLIDLIKILAVLSNASKLGKNIVDSNAEVEPIRGDWRTFENDISQLYRKLGAEVKQNVNLAGFQIDIYVEEDTPSKTKIRSAVECKFYKDKVGKQNCK